MAFAMACARPVGQGQQEACVFQGEAGNGLLAQIAQRRIAAVGVQDLAVAAHHHRLQQ